MNGKLLYQCGCSRRQLLKAGAAVVGGLAMGAGLSGCGADAQLNEDVEIDLSSIAELSSDGGIALAQEANAMFGFGIWVFRKSATEYVAFSGECTHAGCEVALRGQRFECPCHDSHFGADGALIKGPAQSPLKRFATTLNGTLLTIRAE